jgi:hypothetical protein
MRARRDRAKREWLLQIKLSRVRGVRRQRITNRGRKPCTSLDPKGGWRAAQCVAGGAGFQVNRTAAIGGRSRDTHSQAAPPFSLTHSPPVVEPIASVSPSSAQASEWRYTRW